MTRVNCVPVKELCNSHLVAEYHEMLRFRHAKAKIKNIPPSYRMGKGHMKFFHDKGLYLAKRHKEIKKEMVRRGIASNLDLDLSSWKDWQMNDWVPCEEDMKISRNRIQERLDDMISRGIKIVFCG